MRLMLFSFVLSFFLLPSNNRAQNVTPEIETKFLDKLKASIIHRDYTLFSALFCKDGTIDDPEMKTTVETVTHSNFDSIAASSIPEYVLSPVPSDQIVSFSRNKITYQMNLRPVLIITIKIPAKSDIVALGRHDHTAFDYPIGVKDGKLLIARPVTQSPN